MSSFEPNDFLGLARELSNCDATDTLFEAKQRSSVSRAYYSVFLPARARRCPPGAKHAKVFEAYRKAGDRDSISFGNRLETLYADRCRADYADECPDPELYAAGAIEEAESLLGLLGRLR